MESLMSAPMTPEGPAMSETLQTLVDEAREYLSNHGPDEAWRHSYGGRLIDRLCAALSAPAGESFQRRVNDWMMACFGPEIAADAVERNHRFLEEALELVQSCGCTASEAHQLVDYTFGRPIGDPTQEAGGVMVTLAALCLANNLDMTAAGEMELARVWTCVEKIRAKQAAKPKHSPLPAAPSAQTAETKAGAELLLRASEDLKTAVLSIGNLLRTARENGLDVADAAGCERDLSSMAKTADDLVRAAVTAPTPSPDIAALREKAEKFISAPADTWSLGHCEAREIIRGFIALSSTEAQ